MLTGDGVMIVIHDDTLRRTTNAQGAAADKRVASMTYAEIAQYDAGIKTSPRFAGERIPTMAQFLYLLKKLNMGLVLEIKPCMGFDIETARKAVELLEKFDLINYPRLLVQSFLVECLREVKRLQPTLNLGLLIAEWGVYTRVNTGIGKYPPLGIYMCKESVEDVLTELNATALVAYEEILTREKIAEIKQRTAIPYLLSWTVNQPERANELFSQGVDAVLSDNHLIITSLTRRNALASNAALFHSVEKSFLETHRHSDDRLQQEYDKRYGLTKK
jgi:glycerophosphoryl diester phosphodiesterase